jgi:Flp pilus assembly protein TadG
MTLFSQWHRDEEGATSVEVAVCVGAFLLILLGVLEFAIDMWIWNGMTMAVQQGGRTAMVYAQTSCKPDSYDLRRCVDRPGANRRAELSAGKQRPLHVGS